MATLKAAKPAAAAKRAGRSAKRTKPATGPAKPRTVHPRNTLNDLTGAEWLYWSRSLIDKAYPHELGHDLRKKHGGNKPPGLMADLIRLFTKPGDLVLDPFAGVGGTLLGAAKAGRTALGIEINPEWPAIYRAVCEREKLAPFPVIEGDARAVLKDLLAERGNGFADLVATDPPYGLNFERTMCVVKPTNESMKHSLRRTDLAKFSVLEGDLSNSGDFETFFAGLKDILGLLLKAVKPGGYGLVILRNAYQDGRYINVAARVGDEAARTGWTLKGEFVWYVPGTRLRPYGYPKAFVPNIAHQNILVLRRDAS